jgi:recombinational DNA repair protein RecR
MKILITENKRYQLAYKVLDDTLSKLHRENTDLNKGKDSVFSNHQVSFFYENGEKVMEYQEIKGILYVLRDFISPLKVFSFDEEEINRLIKWWFTNRVRIEPEDVYFVKDLRD